jgi:hypothetical protein
LYERFGSWSAAFYGSAVLALIAGALAVGVGAAPLPRKSVPVSQIATPAR